MHPIMKFNFVQNLIDLHPYFGWNLSEHELDIQVTAGYGSGEMEIVQAKYESELLDSHFTTFAVSGRKGLITDQSNLFGDQDNLSLFGESWFTTMHVTGKSDYLNQMQSQVGLFRLYLKGQHQFELENDSKFEPGFTLGIRRDKVNQDSNVKMEVVGLIDYQLTTGLELKGKGGLLIADEEGITDQFIQSEVSYSQGVTGLGLKLNWESSSQGNRNLNSTKYLNSENYVNNLSIHNQQTHPHFNSELRYGLRVIKDLGIITPFTRYSVNYNQERDVQFGSKLDFGHNVDIELICQFNVERNKLTNQQLSLKGNLVF